MSRVVRYLGHYAPWFLGVLVAALIVLTVLPPVAVAVPWPAMVALLVVTAGVALAIFAHNRRLCERCIASLPLNAGSAASRYGLRFRVAHLFERKVFAVAYLVVVAATSFLYDHPVGRYAWAVVQASLAYLLIVYVTHQRLQPWCPHCENGGDERIVPIAPTPVTSNG